MNQSTLAVVKALGIDFRGAEGLDLLRRHRRHQTDRLLSVSSPPPTSPRSRT